MQLKHTIVILTAAGMLSAQAYASEMPVEAAIQPAQPLAAFTDADMAALFDNANQPMQLAALSEQEMRETEGAVIWMPLLWNAARVAVPYVVRHGEWGAAGGAASYFGSLRSSGQRFNSNHLGGALAGGFVGGIVGGRLGLGGAAVAGGFLGGYTQGLFHR